MFEGIKNAISEAQARARARAPATPEQVATRPEDLSTQQLLQAASKDGVEAVIARNQLNRPVPPEPLSGLKRDAKRTTG